MKKIFIVLFFAGTIHSAFAQKGKVQSALNQKDAGKIVEAFTTIQETVDTNNEKAVKSINWPKTWEVRGEIYQAMFQSEDEKVKALSSDPLSEALNSYKRALELDPDNKFSKSIKIKLTLLINDLQTQAYEAYKAENYSKALESFEQILEINGLPLLSADNQNYIDTATIYNAGMMAFQTEEYDKSIEYFQEAAKYGYSEASPYLWLSRVFEQKKDTLNALESLKAGFEKYPGNGEILDNMIQMYLNMNKKDEALHFLDLAIEREPEKATYYLAKGSLCDRNHDNENAILLYEKALEKDPDLFMAYFNIGVIYYNEGVQKFEQAANVPANDNVAYEKVMTEADQLWEKSVPYMEKCHDLNPNDEAATESLKSLYYRLNQTEKYEALQKGSNN